MEVNKNGTNVKVSAPNAAATPNPLMQTAAQLGQGQIPRNDQLQSTINATQIALEEAKHQTPLSAKGQVLVEDVKDLLASGSRLIAEKNADEKLQRLAMDAGSAGTHTRGNLQGTGVTGTVGRGDAALMRGHARSILDNGRSIGMFAVRSGQFRDLLLEVLNVFQSLIQSTQQQIAQQPTNNMQPTSVASGLANSTVVPQQQKDALWDRFVALLNQLGSRPEYYTGVDHIFQVIDHMSAKGQTIKNQTGGTDALPTTEYDRVWQDLKLVFEEFSGTGTMDEFERRNWVLFHAMKEDPEARMWMTNFRSFILETIRQPTTLNDSTRTQYGRGLFDQGRYLFQGKYRPFFQDVFDQMKLILVNIKNDSVTQDFSSKMQKLGADFAFDASGKPDLFVIQESLGQMRMVLVPIMSSALSNLPIPKIEGSNAKYDFSVEGLLLHVGDLLPEFVNFRTKSDTRMSVQRLASNKSSVKVVMEVDRIRANFKDIRFFYRRKRMPKIEDHGIADVDLSQGTGVSLRIVWKLKSSPNQPMVVRLLKVKCNIDRLTITVRNAKHNILDKLATKLFAGTIKKQIANAIVNNIIKTLTPMSAKLNDLFRRKPLTGITERANDAMKTRMMSEEPGLLSRAKDTIVSGAQQAKAAIHPGTSSTTGSIGAPSTTGVVLVEEIPVSGFDNMTFVEKSRDSWAFEWYSPSPTDTLEAVEVLPANTKLGDASRVSSDPFVSI